MLLQLELTADCPIAATCQTARETETTGDKEVAGALFSIDGLTPRDRTPPGALPASEGLSARHRLQAPAATRRRHQVDPAGFCGSLVELATGFSLFYASAVHRSSSPF